MVKGTPTGGEPETKVNESWADACGAMVKAQERTIAAVIRNFLMGFGSMGVGSGLEELTLPE